MPATWTVVPSKAKDDVCGYQDFNSLVNDLAYLKQQSEVVVAEDAALPNEKVSYGDFLAARLVKAPVLLTTSMQTIYTVTASFSALLEGLLICNSDAVGQAMSIHLVPSGGTSIVDNQIWADVIAGNRTAAIALQTILPEGSMVQAKVASASNTVSLHVTPVETTAAFLKSVAPVFLSDALPGSPQYTFTAQGSLVESILCNTDTVRRLVMLHAIPPAGSAGVDNLIFNDYIAAKRTVFIQTNKTLANGATIKAYSDATGMVGMRLSVVEP
jgi:hypothetical protein